MTQLKLINISLVSFGNFNKYSKKILRSYHKG